MTTKPLGTLISADLIAGLQQRFRNCLPHSPKSPTLMTLHMRIASPKDALLMNIRKSDKDEIELVNGSKYPNSVVQKSIRVSTIAVSVWEHASVVAVFGLVLHEDRAVPWFICSDAVDRYPVFTMKFGQDFMAVCRKLARSRPLCNIISPNHTSARKFVQALGFIIDPDHPSSSDRAHFFSYPTNV